MPLSEIQFQANRANAQASTGPTSPEGKHQSAQNSTTCGLFASPANFVRPGEYLIWEAFNDAFQTQLVPAGPVEQILTEEIIQSAWRLRRCSLVEANLSDALDPMENTATLPIQNSVDRARNQAQRHFTRNLLELKRLQTERQFQNEYFPLDADRSFLGLASVREILPSLDGVLTMDPVKHQLLAFTALHKDDSEKKIARAEWVRSAKPVSGSKQTARNAACPCGSGQKYKRCCGENAPAVLGKVA